MYVCGSMSRAAPGVVKLTAVVFQKGFPSMATLLPLESSSHTPWHHGEAANQGALLHIPTHSPIDLPIRELYCILLLPSLPPWLVQKWMRDPTEPIRTWPGTSLPELAWRINLPLKFKENSPNQMPLDPPLSQIESMYLIVSSWRQIEIMVLLPNGCLYNVDSHIWY